MSDPTVVPLRVSVDVEDDEVWAAVEAGEALVVDVDASDVVSGLNNNDGLILAFLKEVLEAAGSSELSGDLMRFLAGEGEGP